VFACERGRVGHRGRGRESLQIAKRELVLPAAEGHREACNRAAAAAAVAVAVTAAAETISARGSGHSKLKLELLRLLPLLLLPLWRSLRRRREAR
jgi:hypothetical protein